MKAPFLLLGWFSRALSVLILITTLGGCDSSGEPDPDSPYHVPIRLTATNMAGLPATASVERLPLARGRQAQQVAIPVGGAATTTEIGPWNASEGVRLTLHYAPFPAPVGGPHLPANSSLVGDILVNGQLKQTVRLDEASSTTHPAVLSVAAEVPRIVKSRGE